MAGEASAEVISHWHQLIDNLSASSSTFYSEVMSAVQRRRVPNADFKESEWSEHGIGSAKRKYLRVSRGRHMFDICAAPFGEAFFFSWWLSEKRPSAIGPTLVLGTVMFLLFGVLVGKEGTTGFVMWVVLFSVLFYCAGLFISQDEGDFHLYLLVIPVLGPLWQRFFRPPTYYEMDTALMFQESVHRAVLEVVDSMTTAKGLRALSELERKPIMRDFFKR